MEVCYYEAYKIKYSDLLKAGSSLKFNIAVRSALRDIGASWEDVSGEEGFKLQRMPLEDSFILYVARYEPKLLSLNFDMPASKQGDNSEGLPERK